MVKNKKDKTCLLIDVTIPSGKNVIQKEAEKKLKYRNSETVEHEMFCHNSNHWGHRNCKQKFTKISGNNTRTILNTFFTKNCHTRNITHHKESATSRDFKPEWWGSPLAQEQKYQGRKKTCDKK
jgi:hypothetical protein